MRDRAASPARVENASGTEKTVPVLAHQTFLSLLDLLFQLRFLLLKFDNANPDHLIFDSELFNVFHGRWRKVLAHVLDGVRGLNSSSNILTSTFFIASMVPLDL